MMLSKGGVWEGGLLVLLTVSLWVYQTQGKGQAEHPDRWQKYGHGGERKKLAKPSLKLSG